MTIQGNVRINPIRHTLESIRLTYCSFRWVCDPVTGKNVKTYCEGDKCAQLERWSDGSVRCGRK